MKTYELDEAAEEFDRIHPSQDCVCERIVASERVHGVIPLPPTLPDEPTVAQLLADAEALNDEIDRLKRLCAGLEALLRVVHAASRAQP